MAGVVESLLTSLSTCFGIIFLGYILGRTEVIPVSLGGGINKFIGMISLPALLFRAMATLDFSTVSWSFVLGVGLAKVLVFVLVLGATALFDVQTVGQISTGALRGIFCTQSNDFALALPIAIAMYEDSFSAWPSFIYLLAPISLILINPIGMAIMEYGNAKKAKAKAKECEIDYFQSSNANSDVSVDYNGIALRVASNPIVFMTFIGFIANFIFSSTLPLALDSILATLGQAFSPCALFLLGHSMVGKLTSLSGPTLLIPIMLSLVKVLVLGIACYMLVSAFGGSSDLKMYAFIVGATPTAPSLQYMASVYNLSVDKISMALVVCTIIGAPVMLIGAQLQLLDKDGDTAGVGREMVVMNVLSLLGCGWVILSFSVDGYSRYRHVFFLALSQALLSMSSIICRNSAYPEIWLMFVNFFRFASMIWGAFIAIQFPARALGYISTSVSDDDLSKLGHTIIWTVSAAFSIIIFTVTNYNENDENEDVCIFSDGLPLLILTILVMSVCLVLQIWSLSGLRRTLKIVAADVENLQKHTEPFTNNPSFTQMKRISGADDVDADNDNVDVASDKKDNSVELQKKQASLEQIWADYVAELNNETDGAKKQKIFSKVSLGFFLISLYQIAYLTVDVAMFVWILVSNSQITVLSFLAVALLSCQGLVTFFVFGLSSDQKILTNMREFFESVRAKFSSKKRDDERRGEVCYHDFTS